VERVKAPEGQKGHPMCHGTPVPKAWTRDSQMRVPHTYTHIQAYIHIQSTHIHIHIHNTHTQHKYTYKCTHHSCIFIHTGWACSGGVVYLRQRSALGPWAQRRWTAAHWSSGAGSACPRVHNPTASDEEHGRGGTWGMGHGAWGMGHGAWGMGHGAWGMGHGAASQGCVGQAGKYKHWKPLGQCVQQGAWHGQE
jgi:hypothetical protein